MEEAIVKAQFIAQYLNQVVFYHPDFLNKMAGTPNTDLKILDIPRLGSSYLKKGFLLLRTVEQLTNEEMDIICKLDYAKFWTDVYKEKLVERSQLLIGNRCFNPAMFAYCLRIGILLPFTYLDENKKPVTLQTSELISMGWAKIKSD